MRSRVIVLAGPSGAGKSRLAERTGLPVLRLDDFYKDGTDPTLPRVDTAPSRRRIPPFLRTNTPGMVDWDHPDSWLPRDAVATMAELCRHGRASVPVYELARDGRCGTHTLDLAGSPLFVAEGIFAQDVVARCRELGLLSAAYCVTQHPAKTFWRRLTRDLRERRKAPAVLVRRGFVLWRAQRRVVADAVAKGCRTVHPEEAFREINALVAAAPTSQDTA